MNNPEPVITERIDGRITRAECSACNDKLDMPDAVGSRLEQDRTLEVAFAKHVEEKHSKKKKAPREDVNQAAARIIREATERS